MRRRNNLVNPRVEIRDLDPHRVSESDKKLLNDFDNLRHGEQWPDDSPRSAEETVGHWRFVPRYLDLHQWAAWADHNTRVVGRATINIGRYDENRHMADFDIYVIPLMRRQGIATALMKLVAQVAHEESRRLLLVSTDAAIPAGQAFVQRLGGRAGVASSTNQLMVEDLNRQLVGQWLARGRRQARELELGMWEGPYPTERLEAMAAIKEVMNTAPTDELEVEEFRWLADDLVQDQQALAQQGIRRWTMYLRHRASDEISGFTEVFWDPRHPELLVQGHTAVLPRYQNRGLAQWLKGEMLEKVLQNHPEVRKIRSDNANSNVAILRINRRLGFRRYKSWTTWQVDLDRVMEYLR